MAANGLTKREQESLSHWLGKLDAVGTRIFLLGKEGREMAALAKRMRDRLNPPTPSELEAEAERLFKLLEGVPCVAEALAEAS
jgi:hypothetical protein